MIFLLKQEHSPLLNYIDTALDQFIFDHGFRWIKSYMPQLLKKNAKQFKDLEANATRKVTLARWLIEAVNARFKIKFKFFSEVIPGPYLKKVPDLLSVAIVLIKLIAHHTTRRTT